MVGRNIRVGKPNIECMVLPRAFMEATPVGATTTQFFSVSFSTLLRKVVFPVPASPVKNTLRWVFSTMSKAASETDKTSIIQRYNQFMEFVIFLKFVMCRRREHSA